MPTLRHVSPLAPAAQCLDCRFTWNSPGMVEGLRLLGTCPRCGTGTLEFRDALPEPTVTATAVVPMSDDLVPPHLVLGVPRR